MSYFKRAAGSAQLVYHHNNNIVSSSPLNNQTNRHTTAIYPTMTYKPYLLKEDVEQKIPLFLVKLWNIVEDPAYREVVRWDETGLSFHIMDPYAFCSNILPQYFKHKNLNSLVRQLNMYGFRKNTPIDRSGLARAESDQDHLEFMHPYFRRDHPELLASIKRKVPNKTAAAPAMAPIQQQLQTFVAVGGGGDGHGDGGEGGGGGTVAVQTKDLSNIFDEIKTLRDRQKSMEMRMEELSKENEVLWTELAHIRGTHIKQQQIVNKLIQFLVALVQPSSKQQGRLGKRHMYVLEDVGGSSSASTGAGGSSGAGGAKRFRDSTTAGPSFVELGEDDAVDADIYGGGVGSSANFGSGPLGSGGGIGCADTTKSIPHKNLETNFSSGRPMNGGAGATGPNGGTTAAQQLQSILPANASEILDRLISDITGSGAQFGTATRDGNYMNGFNRKAPTKLEPNSIHMEEFPLNGHHLHHEEDNHNFHEQQLQPYTGGMGGVDNSGMIHSAGGSTNSLRTSASGPIIADITEELDQLQTGGDGSSSMGGGMFQVGGVPTPPGQGGGKQMVVIVPSSAATASVTTTAVPLGQMVAHQQQDTRGSGFRAYSQSFGSVNAPPMAIKRGGNGGYNQQNQQRKMSQVAQKTTHQQLQTPRAPQQSGKTLQNQHHQQQQQPQMVIYEPITPQQHSPQSPIIGGFQAQQLQPAVQIHQDHMGSNQQQQQQLMRRQCPTAPPYGNHYIMQTSPQQQQQPMHFDQSPEQVFIGQNDPSAKMEMLQMPAHQQSSELDVPLTDGMVLNEHEMADIAGLNAYLDENGSRFHTLTNSIGEHWNDVVNVDPDDFHDLFEYSPPDASIQPQQLNGGGGQTAFIGAEHGQHLDFAYATNSSPQNN